jgi:hypothetical protein
MSSALIAKLGILFLVLGLCATFLMYWLWGFPFDKETRTSAAPKVLMYTHRLLGYLFVFCYIAIMWHMVPRLWTYQVEFPSRTVAHIIIGMTVGFLLLIKISIMRFFRHFEHWMPYLGTSIMLGAVLLIGLSVPFVFREHTLAATAPGGSVYSAESRTRVAELLPTAGLPDDAPGAEVLSGPESLRKGRDVLLQDCVKCHDLRTILIKPRTPANWYRTVERMAEKPALFAPITPEQQWYVTAYLVAITPDLQGSVKMLRAEKQMKEKTQAASAEIALDEPGSEGEGEPMGDGAAQTLKKADVDPNKARAAFEEQCSQCHELEDVHDQPPASVADIDELIDRMIENGMEDVSPGDLRLIKWYLLKRYVDKTIQ